MIEKSRKLWVLLVLALVLVIACDKQGLKTQNTKQEDTTKTSGEKIIYVTFFPVVDLTKMIVRDKMDVKTITKMNEEPHSFELTVDSMKDALKGDLVIHNGTGTESFVDDLKKSMNDDGKFLDLPKGPTLLDSLSEGSDMKTINPHIWLSVKNTEKMLNTIYERVSAIDSENENFCKKNLEDSIAKFDLLDKKLEQELSKVKSKDKYFVVSHAVFNYLADDYGLKQVAMIGISPGDEPTAKQLKTITDFMKDKHISTIFFEGRVTPKVVETLAKNINMKTSTLHTMENLDENQVTKGYLKLMEGNLKSLVEAFNE